MSVEKWNESGRVWEEDHGLLDAKQVTKCARAETADTLRSPVPTRMISNGEYMPVPQTEKQKRVEARIEELAVRRDQRENQGAERNKHKPVRHPDLGPLQHPGVPEGLGEQVLPTPARLITSAGSRLAELDDADDRCHGADEDHDTDDRDRQRHDDRGDFHVRLLLGAMRFSLVGAHLGQRRLCDLLEDT